MAGSADISFAAIKNQGIMALLYKENISLQLPCQSPPIQAFRSAFLSIVTSFLESNSSFMLRMNVRNLVLLCDKLHSRTLGLSSLALVSPSNGQLGEDGKEEHHRGQYRHGERCHIELAGHITRHHVPLVGYPNSLHHSIAAICCGSIDYGDCDHSPHTDNVEEDADDGEEGDAGGAAGGDRVKERI